jgi:ATP-dependent helicase/DNAse subunit B
VLDALARQLAAGGRAPLAVEVGFGQPGSPLPPITRECEGGRISLRGYIDRIDVGADGAAAVTDYKVHGAPFDWARFLAGEQIQLLTYLVALDARDYGGVTLSARAAGFQRIEPKWEKGAADFESKDELLPGPKVKTDPEALRLSALAQTRRIIDELGGRILGGEYLPLPLRKGRDAACARCGYRAVCRFDPQAGGSYRELRGGSAAAREAVAAGLDLTGSALPGWEMPK